MYITKVVFVIVECDFMKGIWFIGLLVIIVLISGCIFQPKTETISQPTITQSLPTATVTETEGTITETATPAMTPAPVLVQIKGFAYNPSTINIPQGTTVTWAQMDSGVQHTVTGNDFDSGNINAGDTFKWTFNKIGTFSYSCSNHPNVIGIVVVT
jgi:plastocyanin